MKKAVVIFLLLIYGSATMGATIHLHYCMDEFVGWSLLNHEDEKCGKCGMDEKESGGCCKDEHKQFKLKVDHQKSKVANFIDVITTPALFARVVDPVIHSSPNTTKSYPTCHAPPGISKYRLHVLHCVFLI